MNWRRETRKGQTKWGISRELVSTPQRSSERREEGAPDGSQSQTDTIDFNTNTMENEQGGKDRRFIHIY